MTREAKHKLLADYPFLTMEIANLNDKYEELLTTATKITTSYDNEGGGSSHSDDKFEKRCIKLAEVSNRIEKLKRKQGRIDRAVSKLKPYYRFLVTQIDINGQSVYRFSKIHHKDVSSLTKTHNKALDSLEL